MKQKVLSLDELALDSPIRLQIAAVLAFPDGTMSASGLRREALRGNLAVERIAGKDYTTLEAIRKMREKCRVEARAPGCGGGRSVVAAGGCSNAGLGLSSTKESTLPRDALLAKINKRKSS